MRFGVCALLRNSIPAFTMTKPDKGPNNAEEKYLQQAYKYFYDVFEEVFTDTFWEKDKYYRFSKTKDIFSIYAELLNYEPIKWVIEHIRKSRPPMEAEIGSVLFKFIRNVVIHFPYFENWDDVWLDSDVVNWNQTGQSIDKFLRKYEAKDPVKYRMWNPKKKEMTYLSINLPGSYSIGKKIYLKDILKEREGVEFSLAFMKKVIDTQVED